MQKGAGFSTLSKKLFELQNNFSLPRTPAIRTGAAYNNNYCMIATDSLCEIGRSMTEIRSVASTDNHELTDKSQSHTAIDKVECRIN